MKRVEDFKRQQREWFIANYPYQMRHWSTFDYSVLNRIRIVRRNGKGENTAYNDMIIAADTETSKKPDREDNHVCAWTITIRAYNINLVTLYGHKPSTFCECLQKIIDNLKGDMSVIYFHYLAYDYAFLRKFLFRQFGTPKGQLNTKSHYPIRLEWNNFQLRDSLILFQRSLDKTASDYNVEHQKALGKWDYDRIRNQDEEFTSDELEYIEHDTLALAESIDALMYQLNKNITSIPYTATGIPREQVRKKGAKFYAHDTFVKYAPTYDQYKRQERVYHGGYTHANRHFINVTINEKDHGIIKCFDFSSSYPAVLLTEKFPCEAFNKLDDKPLSFILEHKDDYAFIFNLVLIRPRLKDDFVAMPALQYSKCSSTINAIVDNGRILYADYVEIELTEIDAAIIAEQYQWDKHVCENVEVAKKDYLPRWFTDYVYEKYEDKCKLKGGDPVAYALSKSIVNSIYGMTVQKWIRETLIEDFETGEYVLKEKNEVAEYEKYLEKYTSILPYDIGIWCTAYAMQNLFKLGKCCSNWLYSDTDSCYGYNWSEYDLIYYNNSVKNKLLLNGYEPVVVNEREYWPGVAELDGEYSEFRVVGAKRYCCRDKETGKLKITVAGVPKKGVAALDDNIENFKKGFIFPASVTDKITHTYIYVDKIYVDNYGNETGDSINLTPCEYLLDSIQLYSVDDYIITDEVTIYDYEE